MNVAVESPAGHRTCDIGQSICAAISLQQNVRAPVIYGDLHCRFFALRGRFHDDVFLDVNAFGSTDVTGCEHGSCRDDFSLGEVRSVMSAESAVLNSETSCLL